ncbi:unnamed protein product [Coffea canephora]|uniref:DH200=94 genomic scaffold, scaffold_3556 n=1 Tax=Coffea canephora TaxID=49390 RepID=A0A068VL91_COFCA|nr:unnamed protein product [Coffea canephora]
MCETIIHRPGFRILELFDKVIMLSGDIVLRDGPLDCLEERLKSTGHCIPQHVNILEYAIDVSESLPMEKSDVEKGDVKQDITDHVISTSILSNIQEKHLSYSNSSRGSYRISSYAIADTLVFVAFLLQLSPLFTTPLHWLVGLRRKIDGSLFLSGGLDGALNGKFFCSCISALAPNFISGMSLIAGHHGCILLFSRGTSYLTKIPKCWLFMHYLSLMKYPLECLLLNKYGGYKGRGKCSNLVVMLAFIVGYRLLCYLTLWYRSCRTRS